MPLSVHVWDFLDRNFETIRQEATLAEAMEAMSQAAKVCSHTRSLVVLDDEGAAVGVISMRNILDAFKPEFNLWTGLLGRDGWTDALQKGLKESNYRLVKDFMVKVPFLKLGDTLLQAFKILTEKNLEVRMVPVVEAGKVEGVVRIPDLFEAFVDAYSKIR